MKVKTALDQARAKIGQCDNCEGVSNPCSNHENLLNQICEETREKTGVPA